VVQPEFEAALEIIVLLYKLIQRRHKKAIDIVRQVRREAWT
jgi:hypothetical protein